MVASKIGLGALVFLLGRLAIVAVHELARGLMLASYGRRIERAGLKLVLIFPYAFVDTSQAWLEPRRRRIAVSAAGPGADLTLGAVFALGCLAAPRPATPPIGASSAARPAMSAAASTACWCPSSATATATAACSPRNAT